MPNWDKIVRDAKDCHTKQAWEFFFREHSVEIAIANNSKPLAEIFRLLAHDSQSSQYDPEIFATLIKGCLSCWDLELGQQICSFCSGSSNPRVNIACAKMLLESGQPGQAKQVAARALRHTKITPKEQLQLEVLVCSSYTEIGKHHKAMALLAKLERAVEGAKLADIDSADLKTEIARMHYFRGQYNEAAKFFRQAADHCLAAHDWEGATKCLFNTAACFHNGTNDRREDGFACVEKAREIAEAHNFHGPLAHIQAFYGLDAYHHGRFSEAVKFFRRALEVLPVNDNGSRRLHILSMLAITYLATGKYALARKFGHQTIDLAALDQSDRYKTRYLSLEAELLWEDGKVTESQMLLHRAKANFKANGIHTLEELSTYSRCLIQWALMGEGNPDPNISIDQSLMSNVFNWLEYQKALAEMKLSLSDHSEAQALFRSIERTAREKEDFYHEAAGLLGQAHTALAHDDISQIHLEQIESAIEKIGDTTLRVQLRFIEAGLAYRHGDFEGTKKILKSAAKSQKISFADKFVLNCWLATVDGHSTRLAAKWQTNMVSRFTRIYFSPSVKIVNSRRFVISGHYEIDLERYPSVADFLNFLLAQANQTASLAAIQQGVWHQSIHSQGWQQKIRNTIMRARDLFPFTMAPLLLHQDQVAIFSDAITFIAQDSAQSERESKIQELLLDHPMTSQELASCLNLSPATTKRTLKKMADECQLEALRDGRNIFYSRTIPQLPQPDAN